MRKGWLGVAAAGALAALTIAMACLDASVPRAKASSASAGRRAGGDRDDAAVAAVERRLEAGRKTFRFETFGDEAFWGGTLKLHQAIEGQAHGGVGPGVSPRTALAVGLKVDVDALPKQVVDALRAGQVNLDDPATTLLLLKQNAVVGVTGFPDDQGNLRAIGIQCALCHSRVDDSLAPGIGHRLDGWSNQDLDVGAIVNLSPDLSAVASLLGVDEATVRTVLKSWGPGRFDAELFMDGKAFRPDGKTAATLIPPAFGLSGVNLHTWTGWGSVTHWNGFVANLEMHGQGTFYDPRLDDATKFPVAAAHQLGHVRNDPDLVTPKLADLHLYQGSPWRRRAHPTGASTPRRRSGAMRSSAGRRSAPPATSARSSPSPAGTSTRRRRSGSTASRRAAPRTAVTGPPRCAACGPTRRAASITTGGSRRSATWSTTTTGCSPWGSPIPRRRTWPST